MEFWENIFDDEEEVKEVEYQIRLNVKMVIRTTEIFWEELQKSNLPENVKMQLLLNSNKKGE